jgi:uncharacterized protein YjbJ (UPF0337 family)
MTMLSFALKKFRTQMSRQEKLLRVLAHGRSAYRPKDAVVLRRQRMLPCDDALREQASARSARKSLKQRAAPDGMPIATGCLSREKEKETLVNWDRIEGNWKQLKGKAKQQWGKLTDDQLDVVAGNRDQLAGKIQEQYGISKDEAEKQLDEFESRWRDWNPKGPRS